MEDDKLKLLMDSYREQIQLNTRLLERQERFIDRLDASTHELVEAINAQTTGLQSTLTTGLATVKGQLSGEHGNINMRIYVALGGMVSILITLIAIWMAQ